MSDIDDKADFHTQQHIEKLPKTQHLDTSDKDVEVREVCESPYLSVSCFMQ